MRKSKDRVPLDIRALSAREELFRLSGATKRDAAVDAWLAGEPQPLRSMAGKSFSLMRGCGKDVRELIHDGCPVACVDDAAFAYVNSFKSHVNVGFFNGASLPDPAALLQGSGKRMRHVKLLPGMDPQATALRELIAASYTDIRQRLSA